MLRRFCVILFVGALLKLTQCAPATTTATATATPAKGRAYEFGFEIDQNQHRHEKRDENGIVMGEFGFITADGIYHVTVYATDENGRFKILAMKSYPYGNREKKMMIAIIPPIRKTVAVPAIVKAMPTDTKSCGGCILTKKMVPLPASVAAPMPGAQVFKPLLNTMNGATPSTPSRPSSIPLPPRLPSVPSLQMPKPNAIGSGQPKATTGSSKNGKPVQPFGQIPGDRQNKVQGTPQQIDVRLESPKQPNKVATVGTQNKQGNKPSVGGTFNPLFRNPFNSPANNIHLSQQETQSTLNTFAPKPFQLVNNVLPNGQSYVNTALPTLSRPANTIFQQAPLTPNRSFQQAPLTPNTSFQQAPLRPNTSFQQAPLTPNTSFQQAPLRPNTSFQQAPLTPNTIFQQAPLTPNTSFQQAPLTPNTSFQQAPLTPNTSFQQAPLTPNTSFQQAPLTPNTSFQQAPLRPNTSFQQAPLRPNTIFQQAPLTPNTSFQQAPLTPNTSFQQAPLTPNRSFQQQAPLTPNTIFQQAPLTPNTSFQQAPLTPNTSFQQAPSSNVFVPPFRSNNPFTQPQLTNRYSQTPNGKGPLHTTYTPTLSNQTPTRNTIQPPNTPTLLQQTGFVSSPSSVLPQLTNVRRPALTNGGIPLGLHKQNTNVAQTPTSKLPSTQNLTPSSQSIGKTTPSLNNGGGPLYRFNYVLDYNSHREEGRLDGSKEGNYKTIGEDGIRRIIDYIANENGYQPHIKWEPVPPNELPTGENKLKEYEFVWFN